MSRIEIDFTPNEWKDRQRKQTTLWQGLERILHDLLCTFEDALANKEDVSIDDYIESILAAVVEAVEGMPKIELPKLTATSREGEGRYRMGKYDGSNEQKANIVALLKEG